MVNDSLLVVEHCGGRDGSAATGRARRHMILHPSDTFMPPLSGRRGTEIMNRRLAAAIGCGLLMVAALGGCASNNGPTGSLPGFNEPLATADAKLNVEAAQAVISTYH